MIPEEREAEIVRLYENEKWRVGTIVDQLSVHPDVVKRVLAQHGVPKPEISRSSMIDPFIPFIGETWVKYPKLPASRLYEMCKQRGYEGTSPDHFRHAVAPYRPRPKAEAYLRLKTLPGEQAQVDWGHFGKIIIGSATWALMAFVMVLSYSRRIFLRFFLGQKTENFLRGHEAAFVSFGGVPRVLLYDNLKSAVLERKGSVIRFNPLLLSFAKHYRFEPRPVAVARGNEKGRVERAIRYIRRSFYLARKWRDLDDLNRQAEEWCLGAAMERRWQEDDRISVAEAFERDQPRLLPLPEDSFATYERCETTVRKTPYVRFDRNDYSVPHTLVGCTLMILADQERVRILDDGEVVAEHQRSYDRRQQIENPAHIEDLVQAKREAKAHRGFDRLFSAAPSSHELMDEIAHRNGQLGSATRYLLRLLDEFGAVRVDKAICEALDKGTPHQHAVRQILERDQKAAQQQPALPVDLPNDPRIRDLTVKPHSLENYDALTDNATDTEQSNDDDCSC